MFSPCRDPTCPGPFPALTDPLILDSVTPRARLKPHQLLSSAACLSLHLCLISSLCFCLPLSIHSYHMKSYCPAKSSVCISRLPDPTPEKSGEQVWVGPGISISCQSHQLRTFMVSSLLKIPVSLGCRSDPALPAPHPPLLLCLLPWPQIAQP